MFLFVFHFTKTDWQLADCGDAEGVDLSDDSRTAAREEREAVTVISARSLIAVVTQTAAHVA